MTDRRMNVEEPPTHGQLAEMHRRINEGTLSRRAMTRLLDQHSLLGVLQLREELEQSLSDVVLVGSLRLKDTLDIGTRLMPLLRGRRRGEFQRGFLDEVVKGELYAASSPNLYAWGFAKVAVAVQVDYYLQEAVNLAYATRVGEEQIYPGTWMELLRADHELNAAIVQGNILEEARRKLRRTQLFEEGLLRNIALLPSDLGEAMSVLATGQERADGFEMAARYFASGSLWRYEKDAAREAFKEHFWKLFGTARAKNLWALHRGCLYAGLVHEAGVVLHAFNPAHRTRAELDAVWISGGTEEMRVSFANLSHVQVSDIRWRVPLALARHADAWNHREAYLEQAADLADSACEELTVLEVAVELLEE